jgi:hypothetical protein
MVGFFDHFFCRSLSIIQKNLSNELKSKTHDRKILRHLKP